MDDAPHDDEPEESAQYSTHDLMMAAVVMEQQGDLARSFAILETAALRGNIDSMIQVAVVAARLGRRDAAYHWVQTAADAGDPVAMNNLGVLLLEDGDLQQSLDWASRAAHAGNLGAYASVVEALEQLGDHSGAREWASAGAEQGEPRCLQLHASNLLKDDMGNLEEAVRLLEEAGDKGNVTAMVQAGIAHIQGRSDADRARYWLLRAREAGDSTAAELMTEYRHLTDSHRVAQRERLLRGGRQLNIDRKAGEIQAPLRTDHLTQPPVVADAYGSIVASLAKVITAHNTQIAEPRRGPRGPFQPASGR